MSTTQTQRKRLLKEYGNVCWKCGLTEWQGEPIPLELHHIDGNRKNDLPENLALLCPNCHSTTPNFSKRVNVYHDDDALLDAIKSSNTLHEAFIKLDMTPCGWSYARVNKLKQKCGIESFDEILLSESKCKDCGKEIPRGKKYCPECLNKHNKEKCKRWRNKQKEERGVAQCNTGNEF